MRTTISAFVLAVALALPAFAQHEDKPVLMDKAPFHVPAFANDYIILMRINIPPGRDTGFHTHYADSVSVNLAPALRTDQLYGSSEISAPSAGEPVPGRVSFTNITRDGQRTHKASNVGPTAFRTVSFILKDSDEPPSRVSDRSGVAGYNEILDNERIRAWRVILEPGQATGQITQTAPGLRVYVRGGVVDELVPDSADRGMAPNDGDFMWQDAGQTRAVKNTGATVVEFVEFELR
ncbi:MAG TPA: hypothetical protein VIV14_11385 [Gammaproteobacteria bacterium]